MREHPTTLAELQSPLLQARVVDDKIVRELSLLKIFLLLALESDHTDWSP